MIKGTQGSHLWMRRQKRPRIRRIISVDAVLPRCAHQVSAASSSGPLILLSYDPLSLHVTASTSNVSSVVQLDGMELQELRHQCGLVEAHLMLKHT